MIEYPTSLEDPRLDVYARLTELQLRNRLEPEKGIFIAESDKVIDRALAAGYQPISLLVPEHRFERMAGLVDRMGGNKPAEEGGLTVFVMPAEEVEKLAGYELTRGVLCPRWKKRLPMHAVLPSWKTLPTTPTWALPSAVLQRWGWMRFCARLHAAILCTVVRFVFLWARCSRCLGRALGSSRGRNGPRAALPSCEA